MRIDKKYLAFGLSIAIVLCSLSGMDRNLCRAKTTDDYGIDNPNTGFQKQDCIYFGRYWQDDTNGDGVADQKDEKMPIKWRVLERDGDDVFLMADQALDCQAYNEEDDDNITWESCSLRKWLNSTFLENAFTEEEQNAIKTTEVENGNLPSSLRDGGASTKDKIYLLSWGEAKEEKYGFPSKESQSSTLRCAKPSAYAKNQMVETEYYDESANWSWLRSPGSTKNCPSFVDGSGSIVQRTFLFTYYFSTLAVRPVLHLNLSVDVWSEAEAVDTEYKTAKWDCIYFGRYWQEDTNGDGVADKKDEKTPVKWRVLSRDGDDVFLISDALLDLQIYGYTNSSSQEVDWKTCNLRKWLNENFYQEAFDSEEQKAILETTVVSDDHSETTKDKVYLLSPTEAENEDYGFCKNWEWKESTTTRQVQGTDFSKKKYEEKKDNFYGIQYTWWLRSQQNDATRAAYVNDDGSIKTDGSTGGFKYIYDFIRPVLHLKLSSEVWSNAGTVDSEGNVEQNQYVTPSPSRTETPVPTTTVVPQGDILSEDCLEDVGCNEESQDYSIWSTPVKSYMVNLEDGNYMCVRNTEKGNFVAEYFTPSYELYRTVSLAEDYDLWGGFLATEDAYYVATGQENDEEDKDKIIINITKYDHTWKVIGKAGLKDAYTTLPFDYGSLRMAASGRYLIVRTSRKMNTSDDGVRHQSNLTFEVDTASMEVTDKYTSISNTTYGYVSHSFNQFVQIENGHIVAVDQGDGEPRSMGLILYPTDVSDGIFQSDTCKRIDVLKFFGDFGENITGASLGGFEISDEAYLVTGNSVQQNENMKSNVTRNIFVGVVNKETSEVKLNWLTNYEEGEKGVSTPQFVQLTSKQFMVLWSREGKVYYTKIDANGEQTGEIYSKDGALSDCKPIVSGDKLVWYTCRGKVRKFYSVEWKDTMEMMVETISGEENNTLSPTEEPALSTPDSSETESESTQAPVASKTPDSSNENLTDANHEEENSAGDIASETKENVVTAPESKEISIGNVTYRAKTSKTGKKAVVVAAGNVKSITIRNKVKIDGKTLKVTDIDKNAFKKCKKLRKITIRATSLKKIGKNAFRKLSPKTRIKVPEQKKKSYQKMIKKSGISRKIKIR